MNDIENEIFTKVAGELRKVFEDIYITGEYVMTPPKFPHVSIIEADSYIDKTMLDTSDTEKLKTVMYEVNVYSNKTSGKKSEAKAIMDVVDDMFYKMNLIRIARTPVPNMENASIYRLTSRYEGVTDGTNIYRRA